MSSGSATEALLGVFCPKFVGHSQPDHQLSSVLLVKERKRKIRLQCPRYTRFNNGVFEWFQHQRYMCFWLLVLGYTVGQSSSDEVVLFYFKFW